MHLPTLPTRLRDLQARPWPHRILRVVVWVGIVAYFATALLVLVMRYSVLPQIAERRGDIERTLSESLKRPVTIGAIDGRWQGFWPNLQIHDVRILDTAGRTALALNEVEADLAWASLWRLQPHFARLEIVAPSLDLRRDVQGHLFVAGLEIDPNDQSGGFSDWLLAQDRVVIRDATITWNDELRGAPPLALSRVNFDLRNSGSRHRFGFTAEPPRALAARLDLRGDFKGSDLADLDAWKGEAYAELDYADLAGWRAWVDYPLELPRGSGGLRLWLGFAQKALTGVTADIRLSNVAVRLGKDLPMLELDRVDGRLSGRHTDDAYVVQAKHLALATRDGIQFGPTDVDAEWRATRGEASANGLDLGALAALAGYLPFDATLRDRLLAYGLRGRVDGLRLSWTGNADQLTNYALKARFEDLGLKAQGIVPGFSGLDGVIDGNERGGTLALTSRDAEIELPSVFQEATVTLATLDARADWKIVDGKAEVRIERATFQNDDAAGEASGTYRGNGSGPGEIDLSAKLTRAGGGAVWRYMPLVVNQQTRDWLQRSIVGGAATATLRLKGDLKRFPFSDGSGIFEVKGPFQGATLRYAPGWPEFDDVIGDLEFVGARMIIRAKQAKLWGVALADVKAEIANLDKPEEPMIITGIASGPTADFLRFIEASPVGEHIDHFTEDMAGTGNGELHLRLDMPLQHIADTKVDGRYRFGGNGLTYDPDMPPLADVNGELHFSGNDLTAKKIRATMLGAPMTLDVTTQDGRVAVAAAGTMTVRGLRQQFSQPIFDHLSGSSPWTGTIQVRKRASEVRIQSSLQGISSSLPEPFNKSANDTMSLVFERKPPPELPAKGRRPVAETAPAERDQLTVSLGEVMRLRLVRRHDKGKVVVEQGALTIGRTEPRLPERGVILAVQAKRLDADFWRRAFNGSGGSSVAALPLSQVELRAEEVRLWGRSINSVELVGNVDNGTWKFDLGSREATGSVEWNGEGQGRLSARLSRFALPENPDTSPTAADSDTSSTMPAINLAIDHFLFHGRDLGALKARAENSDGAWSAKFEVTNDDGVLDGTGRWRPSVTQTQTQVNVKLTAKSVEKLLGRFGYPGAVRRGTANIEGDLSWAGPPTGLDYASLNGKFKLEAANGQFNKLEPGVGRLLGIMSLQSLPRRISLDFRDIFSEGFAFDGINGSFVVTRGVMDTKDLQIQGPAAKVLMNGSVNLVNETQDLKVRVQPALGESVATGVLLIHPAVGAAAWALNKIFGNPFDKAFAFDYAVTGSWTEPKVEKLGVQGPAGEQKPPSIAP
jgi:uncharacterized protein (TIGR02099 family)